MFPRDCRLRFTSPSSSAESNGTAVFHFAQNVFPKASGLSASLRFADFLGGHLTQSLSNKHFVFVWLFCSSSVYESKLSTQPRNKKAYHFVIGFVANIGASLEEFAGDIRAILDAKLKNR
jgi:hypothetical protein